MRKNSPKFIDDNRPDRSRGGFAHPLKDYFIKNGTYGSSKTMLSACTVVTDEVKEEAVIAIKTFKDCNGNIPIIVFCGDAESHKFFIDKNYNNCEIVLMPVRESVTPKPNQYHRTDAIALKMDALQYALDKYDDCLFFDADFIFLAPIAIDLDCEVMISLSPPVLHRGNRAFLSFGFFNSGLVWTCNKNFPSWWREQYVKPNNKFIDQLCFNDVPHIFRTGYFDPRHNHGFWCRDIGKREVKSIHCHMSKKMDERIKTTGTEFIWRVRNLRCEAWERILAKYGEEKTVSFHKTLGNRPKKIFFVHQIKAAGTYSLTVTQDQFALGMQNFNSWKLGMNRDWSEEELSDIIETKDNCFLHQHHAYLSSKQAERAKELGWTIFSFYRNPISIITSFFFWAKEYYKKQKKWHLPQDFDASLSEEEKHDINKMFRLMLKSEFRYMWAIPKFYKQYDHFAIFNEQNFNNTLAEIFGYYHRPIEKLNVSENKPIDELLRNGLLDKKLIEELMLTEEYALYKDLFPADAEKHSKDIV